MKLGRVERVSAWLRRELSWAAQLSWSSHRGAPQNAHRVWGFSWQFNATTNRTRGRIGGAPPNSIFDFQQESLLKSQTLEVKLTSTHTLLFLFRPYHPRRTALLAPQHSPTYWIRGKDGRCRVLVPCRVQERRHTTFRGIQGQKQYISFSAGKAWDPPRPARRKRYDHHGTPGYGLVRRRRRRRR